jgi:hypothetical protein
LILLKNTYLGEYKDIYHAEVIAIRLMIPPGTTKRNKIIPPEDYQGEEEDNPWN